MSRTNDQTIPFQVALFRDHLSGKDGEILLGAFKSIVESGIAATTIRTIAKKAGLNPGIVHYYFKNKDDLLSRVLEILLNNAIANIEALLAADLSPLEKLDAFFDLGLSLFRDRIDEWRALTAFTAHSISENSITRPIHQKLNRRLRDTIIKILEETIGDSISGAKDIALLSMGAIEGMVFQYVLDPRQLNPETSINLLKELFHKAFWTVEARHLSRKEPARTHTGYGKMVSIKTELGTELGGTINKK
jgi:TetR/AcrR family transcriptional repressor of bet genes